MTNLIMGVRLPMWCHSETFARNKQLIQLIVDNQFRMPWSLCLDDTLGVDTRELKIQCWSQLGLLVA